MAKYNHIHKYVRDKLGKQIIFKCAMPGCPHYVYATLAVNRLSVCWYCGAPFVLSKKSIKLKKPHCANCSAASSTKPREPEVEVAPQATMASTFLETILPTIVTGGVDKNERE